MLSLLEAFMSKENIKQPMPRDQHITGQQMLNSADHGNYYAFKPKDMTCDEMMVENTVKDFNSLNRLYTQRMHYDDSKYEVVKLEIVPSMTFFVESYEALGDITGGKCYIVESYDMK
jgi:hypothetical protein